MFPCCNEQGNLERFPAEVMPELEKIGIPYEVILVDDGSKDGTYRAMQSLSEKFPNVVLCRHSFNRGLGAAVRTGLFFASGDGIATLDADLTFSPKEIKPMLEALGDDVACVMGSAFLGRMQSVPMVRRFLSSAVNNMYAFLLRRRFTSTSAICRLYRASDLKKLDLHSESFDINAEILVKLLMARKKVVEIPATLGVRTYGESKINVAREIKNHLHMFARILLWKQSAPK